MEIENSTERERAKKLDLNEIMKKIKEGQEHEER